MRFCRSNLVRSACVILLLACMGCASSRKPVPVGTIPPLRETRAEDERQGQETLGELSQEYTLSRDDAAKDRVEKLIARLAAASGGGSNTPWHIAVFDAPEVRNAAATRGNFLFVWSGLLEYLRSDEELAVILAHELGHILAGHVMPDPAETMNQAMIQAGGQITSSVVGSSSRIGILGELAGMLAEAALKAAVVNPGQRRLETESEEIGMFVLARAGFDPQSAVNFWERVQNDPDFGSDSLSFLSTHPSGKERFQHLRSIADEAQLARQSVWKVVSTKADLYESPSRTSDWLSELFKGELYFGNPQEKGWLCGNRGCIERKAVTPAS